MSDDPFLIAARDQRRCFLTHLTALGESLQQIVSVAS
jgi:hypothetical protein